jgi:hypothetical protein
MDYMVTERYDGKMRVFPKLLEAEPPGQCVPRQSLGTSFP